MALILTRFIILLYIRILERFLETFQYFKIKFIFKLEVPTGLNNKVYQQFLPQPNDFQNIRSSADLKIYGYETVGKKSNVYTFSIYI